MGIYPASKASVEGEAPSGFAGGGGDASPYNSLSNRQQTRQTNKTLFDNGLSPALEYII
ncbi:MAG: hypothetical protein HZA13_00540 [Nitrospirae bacterium]|nr:hypothetical protein [Nitrospirota bacterium]